VTSFITGTEQKVRFYHYSYYNANRINDDDNYMMGRFTELVLVHFSYVDKIVID